MKLRIISPNGFVHLGLHPDLHSHSCLLFSLWSLTMNSFPCRSLCLFLRRGGESESDSDSDSEDESALDFPLALDVDGLQDIEVLLNLALPLRVPLFGLELQRLHDLECAVLDLALPLALGVALSGLELRLLGDSSLERRREGCLRGGSDVLGARQPPREA